LAWSHDEAAKRLARFGIILANEPIPAPNLRPESAKLKSNLYKELAKLCAGSGEVMVFLTSSVPGKSV